MPSYKKNKYPVETELYRIQALGKRFDGRFLS